MEKYVITRRASRHNVSLRAAFVRQRSSPSKYNTRESERPRSFTTLSYFTYGDANTPSRAKVRESLAASRAVIIRSPATQAVKPRTRPSALSAAAAADAAFAATGGRVWHFIFPFNDRSHVVELTTDARRSDNLEGRRAPGTRSYFQIG